MQKDNYRSEKKLGKTKTLINPKIEETKFAVQKNTVSNKNLPENLFHTNPEN